MTYEFVPNRCFLLITSGHDCCWYICWVDGMGRGVEASALLSGES